MEDRRLLAITATFAGGVLTFVGDTGNNQLTITATDSTSSEVSFTSSTDTISGASSPQSGVTTIIVTLNGGTNDTLTINGSPDADTIAINGTTVTFGAVPYVLADVENLFVNAQANNDTVSATGASVTGQLSFSGGAGTDALSVTGPFLAGALTVEDPDSDDVELTGAITTSGLAGQDYQTDVTLVGNTTLTAGAGDINFAQEVTGPLFDLQADSSGSTIFNGAVDVGGLTTFGPGQTKFNVADPLVAVKTAGNQIYHNPVLLLQDTILTSTAGSIHFNNVVDAADDAAGVSSFGLTVNTPLGNNFINAEIGGDNQDAFAMDSDEHGLEYLFTDATGGVSGQTQINVADPLVAVLTVGNQDYNDAVLLRQDTILTSSGGNITFDNFVDAADNLVAGTSTSGLTVNTPLGNNVFNFEVGGDNQDLLLAPSDADGLEFLTTDATGVGGQTQLNVAAPLIAVMATGDQTYNDAVRLGANTILIGNDISFNNTVDSSGASRDLDVRTTGVGITTFGGNVGVALPLASLTTNMDGTTRLNAAVLNTTGDQNYNDFILVGADAVLTASSGNITFVTFVDAANNGALGTSNFGLTVNTPNSPAVAGKGNNFFNAEIGGGNVVGFDPDGLEFLTTDNTGAAGQTKFNFAAVPNTVLTTLDQTYNDAVLLMFDTVLTSSAGDITFNNFVDAADNGLLLSSLIGLTVNTPAGDNEFNQEVGGDNQDTLSMASDFDGLEFLITDDTGVTGGQTRFNVAAPLVAVKTNGAQLYQDDVLLEADTTLSAESLLVLGAADVTFEKTVRSSTDGANGLTVNAGDVTTFQGKVGDNGQRLEFLATNLPGTTRIEINTAVGEVSINTLLDQTYNEPVVLNSPNDRTVLLADDVTFNATIGGAVANLEDLFIEVSGVAEFNADMDVLLLRNLDIRGRAPATGLTRFNIDDVRVGNSMFFGTPVRVNSLLATNVTTFTASEDVTFNSTLDGTIADVESVVIDAGDDTELNGSVGTLGRLVDLTINKNNAGNPGETTFLRGAVINTSDDQTYNERVEINAVANQVALTAGGDILFVTTVDSEVADQDRLQAQAGTFVRFDGNVGFTKRLESLFAEALNGDVEFRRIDALNGVELDADVVATAKVEDLDAVAGDLDIRAASLIARSRAGIDLDTEIVTLTALNQGPTGMLGSATNPIIIREANAISILSAINNAATGGDVRVRTGGNVMSVFFVSAIGHFDAKVTDTAGGDDDILVFGDITTGTAIAMKAGDDITLGSGSDVRSINSFVYMNIDSASTDAAGGTAIFFGNTVQGSSTLQYPIVVQGNADNDLTSIQKIESLLSPIAILAEGGALDNAFIVTTDASERVNVFATIVDIVGRPLITYISNEQLDLVTLGGDDKVFVQMPEPAHGILANIVRTSTGAGDDSLKINGSTLADTIRVNNYTTDANYRFQVRGDTGETECLQVFGFTGNDIIENSALIASLLDGGNGQDHITGSDAAIQPATGQPIYDVIFGGADADSLADSGRMGLHGRAGDDFLYADHDYNFGSPVQTLADGDVVNGGQGSDVIVALGADIIQKGQGDFDPDTIVGQGVTLTTSDFLFAQLLPPDANNVNVQLQKGLAKKCAMPIA